MWSKSQKAKGFVERRLKQLPPDFEQLGDVINQPSRADLDRAPLGSPVDDFSVRSVYDVRPVNAFDFNVPVSGTFVSDEVTKTLDLNFTVPDGYSAVVRALEVFFDPIPVIDRADMIAYPLRNGTRVPQNSYYIGTGTDSPIKLFYTAGENQTVGVRLELLTVDEFTVTAYAMFYGNLLLKSGRPTNFEIANRATPTDTTPKLAASLSTPTPAPVAAFDPGPLSCRWAYDKNIWARLTPEQRRQYQEHVAALRRKGPAALDKFLRACGADFRAQNRQAIKRV